jgi:hypothetical protein
MSTDAADDLIVKLMNLNAGMHRIIVQCACTGTVDAALEYLERERQLKEQLDAERNGG